MEIALGSKMHIQNGFLSKDNNRNSHSRTSVGDEWPYGFYMNEQIEPYAKNRTFMEALHS